MEHSVQQRMVETLFFHRLLHTAVEWAGVGALRVPVAVQELWDLVEVEADTRTTPEALRQSDRETLAVMELNQLLNLTAREVAAVPDRREAAVLERFPAMVDPGFRRT